jgi:putative membrane protein
MRILFLLLALLFLAAGIVFGALNPAPVTVDFYWLQVPVSLGFALLAAALLGAVLAGLVLLTSVIWPLRARLRRARRQQAGALPADATAEAPAAAPEWTVSRTP